MQVGTACLDHPAQETFDFPPGTAQVGPRTWSGAPNGPCRGVAGEVAAAAECRAAPPILRRERHFDVSDRAFVAEPESRISPNPGGDRGRGNFPEQRRYLRFGEDLFRYRLEYPAPRHAHRLARSKLEGLGAVLFHRGQETVDARHG
jgi:hypothetical protein